MKKSAGIFIIVSVMVLLAPLPALAAIHCDCSVPLDTESWLLMIAGIGFAIYKMAAIKKKKAVK